MSITFEMVKNNPKARTYITQADAASGILSQLDYDKHQQPNAVVSPPRILQIFYTALILY